MIFLKESTSLKLCGVLMVVHCESSKARASAPGTSSRINRQLRFKLRLARGARGEGGGAKRGAPVAARVARPAPAKKGKAAVVTAAAERKSRRDKGGVGI